jgi:uncharacterized protein
MVPAPSRTNTLNEVAMAEDLMRYDQLAQNALRGVVRESLRVVQRSGLPGDHHFYIAFDTRHPGVSISAKLLQRYPREMTIVIQHQYSNLVITEELFEVVLFFDQLPEKLVIPFPAVKGFLDPAVQFGLQFEVVPVAAKAESNDAAEPATVDRSGQEIPVPANEPKVVSLDAFRKK